MEEIYLRRSIRRYTDRNISDEDMKKILKAGMNAPSAHNQKLYDLVVVKNKDTLKKLANSGAYTHMLEYANAAIIVCSVADDTVPYWQSDCGAVTENILLEATSLGIGSCWIGGYPNTELTTKEKEILEIPKNYEIFSTISLGYPQDKKEPNNNYYEDKVHYEKF